VAVQIAVSCELADAAPILGVTKDLGIGGAFIECAEPPPFGTPIVVVGRLPGTTNDLRLQGIVRWVKADGFGVQFGSLGSRETHAILTILK
jgi:type IV pilus assembly protein PilZ